MKTGCIKHPEREPLIKIHRWQVEICDGDTTAAALLSFFEYWHNIKIEMQIKAQRSNDVAQMHGDARTQDESLFQFHSEEDLIEGIMIAKRDTIRKGIKHLEGKGFISIHHNPNPKYAFDKTRYFLFHPEPINEWLANRPLLSKSKNQHRSSENQQSKSKNRSPSSENQLPSSKNQPPSSKFTSAITEITSEITSEITHTPLTPQRGESECELEIEIPGPQEKAETKNSKGEKKPERKMAVKQTKSPRSSLENDEVIERDGDLTMPTASAPPWQQSDIPHNYHSGFLDYLVSTYLPTVGKWRDMAVIPTLGDAKNWIALREKNGNSAQIHHKWDDYQQRHIKSQPAPYIPPTPRPDIPVTEETIAAKAEARAILDAFLSQKSPLKT
ncbi:hypothetical protein [Merismopedia glauca]|uniref:Uncharacterized protein n=1 Tax=Merismopedia glauca CCAP 1448/3 TaxID=1296344 RepID=A0A2T1C9L7_9CYAN|nr:hypothetical protein [Merismopedia glauca]PSB04941.1 hypothetical protein C7B64_01560 [Merismopedia glauca CCAP 1448/3]